MLLVYNKNTSRRYEVWITSSKTLSTKNEPTIHTTKTKPNQNRTFIIAQKNEAQTHVEIKTQRLKVILKYMIQMKHKNLLKTKTGRDYHDPIC